MLQIIARSVPHPRWALVMLGVLGACGLPGGRSYSGSVPPHEDAALDAFLAETRLAKADRVRLAALMGNVKGRSLSWLTADPKWLQLDLGQRKWELQHLLTRFGSSSLSSDRALLFESARFQLLVERTSMDWRGRDVLWPERGEVSSGDWLLGDAAPVELEEQSPLGDGTLLTAWFERVQAQGNDLVALDRELAARQGEGLPPAAHGVARALDQLRTARESQLPQWLALLSKRLTEETDLSEIESAQWRARGAEVLQVALGERLDMLDERLAQIAKHAPEGSLAGSNPDQGYYRHLLLTATSLSVPPLEFHARHEEAVQAILEQFLANIDQDGSSSTLSEYLATNAPTSSERESSSGSSFSAWFDGWTLYQSARGDDLSDLVLRLNAYALSVTDTGIHAKGWIRDEASKYLIDSTSMGREAASQAIDDILLYPGRAVGAPVGYEQFLSIRARCERRWGPQFDDGPLHELIQASGPAPLEPLRMRIVQWMKTR
ncbi:MAG TPA: DUF885 family protein [Planctomycetota bacterium]|nr:DUF885 family protein [Planctomycetota bacterium]